MVNELGAPRQRDRRASRERDRIMANRIKAKIRAVKKKPAKEQEQN